jgi:hypothetical protein
VTIAHVMGMPLEESALSLAPIGVALASGALVAARGGLARAAAWLRRR